jgi:hypothetical protein
VNHDNEQASTPPRVSPTHTISVAVSRLLFAVFLSCVSIEIALFVLDATVNFYRGSPVGAIRRLFNITREDGLASLFAVLLTLAVGVVAWASYARAKSLGARRFTCTGWLFVAILFTYLAIDDGAKIHERLGTALKFTLNSEDSADSNWLDFYPSYPWQVIFAPILAASGGVVLVFLWKEMSTTIERVGVVAALTCLSVAVALDFVEGMADGYSWFVGNFDIRLVTIKHFAKAIEESIEMFGMTLFLVTFLRHYTRRSGSVFISFD